MNSSIPGSRIYLYSKLCGPHTHPAPPAINAYKHLFDAYRNPVQSLSTQLPLSNFGEHACHWRDSSDLPTVFLQMPLPPSIAYQLTPRIHLSYFRLSPSHLFNSPSGRLPHTSELMILLVPFRSISHPPPKSHLPRP